METHRISLAVVDPERFADAWIDIKKHRTWDDVQSLGDAFTAGLRTYREEQFRRLVHAWSLDGDPHDIGTVGRQDGLLVGYIAEEMDNFYTQQREELEARRKASGTS
jgi:hypothetical protein